MRRRLFLLALPAAALASPPAFAGLSDTFNTEYYTIATAAMSNKIADVRVFLTKGVNPDFQDSGGRTALSYASAQGYPDIAKLLLDAGASPDVKDKSGNTSLHWAADAGHLDVLKMLLAAKATVDAQNKQGLTPLMLAADRGRVAIVRALLDAGANPRKQDFTGRDALGWSSSQPAVRRLLQDAAKK